MDGTGRGDGSAVTATVIRQFAPSRIERQLLAQVFDLVSRDQPSRTNVSAEWSEHHLSAAARDVDEAKDDSRAMSRHLAGRATA